MINSTLCGPIQKVYIISECEEVGYIDYAGHGWGPQGVCTMNLHVNMWRRGPGHYGGAHTLIGST